MKVFILKSKSSVYVVNAVFESKDFYLVPVHNSNDFTLYGKDVFKLAVEEVGEVKVGFKK